MTTCTDEQIEKWTKWGERIGAESILILDGTPRFYRTMGKDVKRGLHRARGKGDKDNYIVEWVDSFERRDIDDLAEAYRKHTRQTVQVIKLGVSNEYSTE